MATTKKAKIRKSRKAAPVVDVKRLAAHDVPVKTGAGAARSAGIQNFILAGRPSKSDFVRVYGPKGPSWTWAQREAAGVSAEQFLAALAKK